MQWNGGYSLNYVEATAGRWRSGSTDIGVNSKLFWNQNDISGLRKLRLICIETVDREKFDEEA